MLYSCTNYGNSGRQRVKWKLIVTYGAVDAECDQHEKEYD